MTTPAVSKPVAELDAVIELMNAKVAGAIFNGIAAFEAEPRRIRDVLIAARTRLGLLDGAREALSHAEHFLRDAAVRFNDEEYVLDAEQLRRLAGGE